jgi:hypothetical protein
MSTGTKSPISSRRAARPTSRSTSLAEQKGRKEPAGTYQIDRSRILSCHARAQLPDRTVPRREIHRRSLTYSLERAISVCSRFISTAGYQNRRPRPTRPWLFDARANIRTRVWLHQHQRRFENGQGIEHPGRSLSVIVGSSVVARAPLTDRRYLRVGAAPLPSTGFFIL